MIVTKHDYLSLIDKLKPIAKIHAIVFKFYNDQAYHYIEFHVNKEHKSAVKDFVYHNMSVINEYKYITY